MFVLITFLVLFLTAVSLVALRLARPLANSAWLVASLGGFLAWVSVFFWQLALPAGLVSVAWLNLTGVDSSLQLVANQAAWVYALSLLALAGAVILTSPARLSQVGTGEWLGTLGLVALALLAILADNPLTLVLAWAALDLLEVFITLRSSTSAALSERTVIAFSIRAVGTGFALWAGVVSSVNGHALFLFEQAPAEAGLFLLLAAGLRLGVLPLHLPYRNEPVLRRGFGTSLRLTTAVTSLVLLARLPASAVTVGYVPYLLGLAALAAFYGGWKWFSAPDELSGRPYWMIALSALAIAATLRGNPAGSAAWGAVLVLFGGLSFLYSVRQVWLTRILAGLGLLLLALPFTLTAAGWLGDFPLPFLFWPPFLAVHLLVLGGYWRHLFRPAAPVYTDLPTWAQASYPVGLGLLAVTALLLGFWGWPGAFQVGLWSLALLLIGLVGVAWGIALRLQRLGGAELATDPMEVRQSRFAFFQERLAAFFWALYRGLGRLFAFASSLLEGDGGLLWTLLLLILFLTLLRGR